jgi:transcriptional regulator with XRE-family HTH domain
VTLREWRNQSELSRRELAEKLRTDAATIYRWELSRGQPDKRIPTSGFMGRIYQLTGGAVAPNDFYDLPPIGQMELPIEGEPAAPLLELAEPPPVKQLQAAA